MSVSFLHCNNILSLVLNGEVTEIQESHPNYKEILKGLSDNVSAKDMVAIINSNKDEEKTDSVTVTNKTMIIDGEPVNQDLVNEIEKLKGLGLPYQGMIRFTERLYKNVSSRARTELLSFIQRNGLTVDSNGKIIAYKAVTTDYMDKHTRTINNSPGSTVTMKRSLVDDNFDVGCSKGLHAGSLDYIYQFGRGNDRIVIVKIDPEDVVCIPKDCDCKKMRVCEYTVIGNYEGKLKRGTYEADWSAEDMYDADDELDYDDDDEFDWDLVEDQDFYDDDDEDDDYYDQEDVKTNKIQETKSAKTPSYYNKRDSRGRFA